MERTENKYDKIIVLGADYHGEWAKDVCIAFRESGMDAELIYTNTLFGGMDSASSVTARASLEKIKQFFRLHARFLFDLVKEIRRRMSEISLFWKINTFYKFGGKICVIFIWTPPSATLLKALKKKKGITLISWQGEPPTANVGWIPSFSYFDHIFSVDEEWIPFLEKETPGKTTYLPLSSSPAKFFPLKAKNKRGKFVSDIAFVGFYHPGRAETLSILKDYDLKIYGYWWESGMSVFPWLRERYGGPLSNENANQAFNDGKIQIGRLPNPHAHGDTVTQRVFDVALAGSFQLSAYSPAIEKIFGSSVPMFRGREDLKKMVDHYLAHPEERHRLATESHTIAMKDHTYKSRIETILRVMDIKQ